MQIANICPTTILPDVIDESEQYHFVSGQQVLIDPTFAQFYRDRAHDYIMLDLNGLDMELMSQVIHTVLPDELVLPAVRYYPPDYCIGVANDTVDYLRKFGIPFMAVPTGDTMQDYLKTASLMSKIKEIKTFGIRHVFFDTPRHVLVSTLRSLFSNIEIHLLGSLADLSDMRSATVRKQVRGISTAELILRGLDGMVVSENIVPECPLADKNYFEQTATTKQLNAIKLNIEYWRKFVS